MAMKRISIQDLKPRLSTAVAEAQAGEAILVTRHNQANAHLFVLRDLTLDLCASNTMPAIRRHARWLAHLRTALWFHAPDRIDRFVTMDSTQEHAAKELGLASEDRAGGRPLICSGPGASALPASSGPLLTAARMVVSRAP